MMKALVTLLGLMVILVNAGYAPATAMTLEEAVAKALQENPQMLAQVSVLKASEQRITQATSGYKPRADLRLAAGWEKTDTVSIDNKELYPVEKSLVITQPLFSGFETIHRHDAARLGYESERKRTLAVAEKISLDTVQAYLQVVRTEYQVKISKINVDNHTKMHERVKLRYEGGRTDRSDMSHMESRLLQAQSNHLTAVNNNQDAHANFIQVVGFPLDSTVIPAIDQNFMPASLDEALDRAKYENRNLLSTQLEVRKARSQYKSTVSPFYPKLDLELSGHMDDDIDGVEGKNNGYAAKVVLFWNLYNGSTNSAERRIQAEELERARNLSNQTYRQVMQEVRLAWTLYETTKAQRQLNQRQVDYNLDTRRLYTDQYEANRRTLLDLLDTENELFNSRSVYINTEFAELNAGYRLLAAISQLLEGLRVDTPWKEAKE